MILLPSLARGEIAGRAIAAAPSLGTVVPAPPPEELTRGSLSEAEGSGDDEGPMAPPDDDREN